MRSIRLKLDKKFCKKCNTVDSLTSQTPATWRANATEIEVGAFENDIPLDLTGYTGLELVIRPDRTTSTNLAYKAIAVPDSVTITANGWTAGTDQHVTFSLTDSELNFDLDGGERQTYWLAVTASDASGNETTLGTSWFIVEEDNNATAAAPEENPGTGITEDIADARYIAKAQIDAKGDIITGSADDTPATLTAGSNGQVLTADSTQAEGLRWTTISGTGDMQAADYDNTAKGLNVYDMDNMDESATAKILTAAERADIAANKSASHDAVTVSDSAEIDLTLTGQDISASIIAGSIDETKLDASTNTSLGLADTSVQPNDDAATLGSGAAADGLVLKADGIGGAAWETETGGIGAVTGPVTSTDNALARYDGTSGGFVQDSAASVDDTGNITANNLSGTNTGDQDLSTYQLKPSEGAFVNGDKTKLDAITGSNTGDEVQANQTTAGIAEVATPTEINTGTLDTHMVTPLGLAGSQLQTDVTANNAKVTNATHIGEVTGSEALTIANRTGADAGVVTGTAGTSGNLVQWNVDGDAVDSALATADVVTGSSTDTLTNKTIDGTGNTITNVSLTTGVTGDLPYANLVPATGISKLVGRGAAAGAGDMEEITLGTGLTMTGTTLSSSGGGGGSVSELSDLSDVNTSTPTSGFALIADGVDFESRAIIAADISDFDTEVGNNSAVALNTAKVTNVSTNLSYTAAPTIGTVTSSDGTNATLPLADATNAGLLAPADFTKLGNTTNTNSGDEVSASTTVEGVIELATQAEVDAGTDALKAVTPDTLSNYSGLGGGSPETAETSIWIDAGALLPDANAEASSKTGTNGNVDVMLMANTEKVYAKWTPPPQWDGGTISVDLYWTATGATAGHKVKWNVAAQAGGNDDAWDTAFPTPTATADDDVIASGDIHIIQASAITVGGTPADGDCVFFEIERTASGATQMSQEAELLGLRVNYDNSLIQNWYVTKMGSEADDASGTGEKTAWVAPAAGKIHAVHSGCSTATAGGALTVDVQKGGTTILSTMGIIDSTETSTSTGTAPVLTTSPTSFAAGDRISFLINTFGGTGAKGLHTDLLISWD